MVACEAIEGSHDETDYSLYLIVGEAPDLVVQAVKSVIDASGAEAGRLSVDDLHKEVLLSLGKLAH